MCTWVAITCWLRMDTTWRGLLDRYIYKAATYTTVMVRLELYQCFISLTVYGFLSLQAHCNVEKLGVGPGMRPVTFCLLELISYTHTYVHILSLFFCTCM